MAHRFDDVACFIDQLFSWPCLNRGPSIKQAAPLKISDDGINEAVVLCLIPASILRQNLTRATVNDARKGVAILSFGQEVLKAR